MSPEGWAVRVAPESPVVRGYLGAEVDRDVKAENEAEDNPASCAANEQEIPGKTLVVGDASALIRSENTARAATRKATIPPTMAPAMSIARTPPVTAARRTARVESGGVRLWSFSTSVVDMTIPVAIAKGQASPVNGAIKPMAPATIRCRPNCYDVVAIWLLQVLFRARCLSVSLRRDGPSDVTAPASHDVMSRDWTRWAHGVGGLKTIGVASASDARAEPAPREIRGEHPGVSNAAGWKP